MDSVLQSVLNRLEAISDQFQELREGVEKAVLVVEVDPEMALTRARKVLELIIRDVYVRRDGARSRNQRDCLPALRCGSFCRAA